MATQKCVPLYRWLLKYLTDITNQIRNQSSNFPDLKMVTGVYMFGARLSYKFYLLYTNIFLTGIVNYE